MDFEWTPEQLSLREELRSFLSVEMTPSIVADADEGYSREFSRKMGQRGLIGLPWPTEYGGRGLGHMERLIYSEEMLLSGAPISHHLVAERQMGPSIIMVGTEEQKQQFLPPIARRRARRRHRLQRARHRLRPRRPHDPRSPGRRRLRRERRKGLE